MADDGGARGIGRERDGEKGGDDGWWPLRGPNQPVYHMT